SPSGFTYAPQTTHLRTAPANPTAGRAAGPGGWPGPAHKHPRPQRHGLRYSTPHTSGAGDTTHTQARTPTHTPGTEVTPDGPTRMLHARLPHPPRQYRTVPPVPSPCGPGT